MPAVAEMLGPLGMVLIILVVGAVAVMLLITVSQSTAEMVAQV
jgi:hypothetical protein